jgi:SAM-dependent methyltransferase
MHEPDAPRDAVRETARSYDRFAGEFDERHRDRAELLPTLERFTGMLPPRGLVLDVGCGSGHDAAAFHGLGFRVAAADLSDGMLALAATRVPGRCVRADLRALPFQPGADGIWACASLLHLPRADVRAALAGFARLLVAGGALCVLVKEGDGGEWRASCYDAPGDRWFTYWTAEELDADLAAAGFRVTWRDRKSGWLKRLATAG